MKVKVIQLAIVPVFALSACTDDDPNRKAMPTQQSQAQVVRHDDGSYSRPNSTTAQVLDNKHQIRSNAQLAPTAPRQNQQPCNTHQTNANPSNQPNASTQNQPCSTSTSGGGGGGGGGGSSQVYDNDRSSSTTKRAFSSRVSPEMIDSQRNITVKSRGGFGATGSFGRAGG